MFIYILTHTVEADPNLGASGPLLYYLALWSSSASGLGRRANIVAKATLALASAPGQSCSKSPAAIQSPPHSPSTTFSLPHAPFPSQSLLQSPLHPPTCTMQSPSCYPWGHTLHALPTAHSTGTPLGWGQSYLPQSCLNLRQSPSSPPPTMLNWGGGRTLVLDLSNIVPLTKLQL